MESIQIERLAQEIQQKRAGKGVREAAKEIGISPATLSRIENKKIPDLDTFGKVCRWLGQDPAFYLGMTTAPPANGRTARVHFKKGTAIKQDSAKALGELIIAVQMALHEEDLEG